MDINQFQGYGQLLPNQGSSHRSLLTIFSIVCLFYALLHLIAMYLGIRSLGQQGILNGVLLLFAGFVGVAATAVQVAILLRARAAIVGDLVRLDAIRRARWLFISCCLVVIATGGIVGIFGVLLRSTAFLALITVVFAGVGSFIGSIPLSRVINVVSRGVAGQGGQQPMGYPPQPPQAPYRPGGPGYPPR